MVVEKHHGRPTWTGKEMLYPYPIENIEYTGNIELISSKLKELIEDINYDFR